MKRTKFIIISIISLTLLVTTFMTNPVMAATSIEIIQKKEEPGLPLRTFIYVGETMDWDIMLDGEPKGGDNEHNDVVWKSSNTSVASAEDFGKIIGKSKGNTNITVTYTPDNSSDTKSLRIKQPVTKVNLSQSSLIMEPNSTKQLSSTISPSNADDISDGVLWESSNTSVAQVNQSGIVTSTGKGTAKITATFTNKDRYQSGGPVNAKVQGSCNVTVRNSVTGINVFPQKLILNKKGAKGKLTPTILPSNADNKGVNWSSANTKIAKVDQNGNVTAVSYGTTTVYAKSKENNSIVASSILKVKLDAPSFSLKKPLDKKKKVIYKAVEVSWKKVNGASKYNIYRSTSSNSSFKLVKSATSGTTKYVDKTPTYTEYYYRVVAVSKDAELNSLTSTKSFVNLYAPVTVNAKVENNTKVKLTWSKSNGATGYEVYRANSWNGTYKKVKTIKNNKSRKWSDKKVKSGKDHFYKVEALKKQAKKTIRSNFSGYKKIYILKFKHPVGKDYRFRSSDFGESRKGKKHKGIDIVGKIPGKIKGKKVYASEKGVVTFSGWQNPRDHKEGYGRYIVIKHSNGFETRYAHNLDNKVGKGAKVKAGDVIAQVGTSGSSSGFHLHFEVRYNGKEQNPFNYLPGQKYPKQ